MDVDLDLTVNIRRVEMRDIKEIMRLDRRVYPSPWSEKMTIEQTTGNGRVHFVVIVDDQIVGHGGIALLAKEAHVTTIAIDPDYQRSGFGSRLLDRLITSAAANQCVGITLEVRAGNWAAIALYETAGFESAGVRPRYYQNDGEDAVIMWKDLFDDGDD